MNPNSFERKARRAVRKKSKKLKRKLSKEELKNLKIQVAPVWMQMVLVIFGVLMILGALSIVGKSMATGIFFILVGAIFVLLGIFGKKKTVENCAGEVGGNILEKFISSLF